MMIPHENSVSNIRIAYVGGGSRGWAWGLMSDLVSCQDISGDVYLYDIDREAAQHNQIIGNLFNQAEGARSQWRYHACQTAEEAMTGADFVIISILPGTFDESQSDIHAPETYGIYQAVGDTTGPGGILRAMRTIPMYEQIAGYIQRYCPQAWVISYTNPMTWCIKTLYRVFPKIKAFGCCHEVFGTQRVLAEALRACRGISGVDRREIKVNPVGVNHFTWLTQAQYKQIDLFPIYAEFAEKHKDTGYTENLAFTFPCNHRVKFDLFRRYGFIAAAGDRHLAEFCEGKWYLENPQKVSQWGFGLTSAAWRKEDLKKRLQRSEDLRSGKEKVQIRTTGEEGVSQIRAILGLCELVTNVNLPNRGQIPNLPLGAVVETNAVFRDNAVTPVLAGPIPPTIYPLISRVCGQQEAVFNAISARDTQAVFNAFCNDPLVTCTLEEAKKLFQEMTRNTQAYLASYDLTLK